MKRLLVLSVLCALLFSAVAANATQFRYRLTGLEGWYDDSTPLKSCSVDFGQSLPSIRRATLELTGGCCNDFYALTGNGWVVVSSQSTDLNVSPYGDPDAGLYWQTLFHVIAQGPLSNVNSAPDFPVTAFMSGARGVNLTARLVNNNYTTDSHYMDITSAYLVLDTSSSVPEPTSILALAGGLVGLIGLRRRRGAASDAARVEGP